MKRSVALLRRLTFIALVGIAQSCDDLGPLSPAEVQESSSLAPSSLSAPTFNQVVTPNPLAACTPVSDISAAHANWPLCVVKRTETQTEVRVSFEGLPVRLPVCTPPAQPPTTPSIAYTTFDDWTPTRSRLAPVPGCANTTNLPAGPTALFWSFWNRAALNTPSARDIKIARPVHTFSLYYSATTSINPTPFSTVALPGNVVRLQGQSEAGAPIIDGTGTSNYVRTSATPFERWNQIELISPTITEVDNRIQRVVINGFEDRIAIDDIYLKIINFRPKSVVSGGPYTIPQGSPLTLQGSVSYDPVDAEGKPHPQGDAVVYHWNFGDGTGVTSATADPVYTYLKKGEYTATLTVTDPNGLSHSTTVPVSVTNVAPAVTAPPSAIALVNEAVVLPATFVDPGADAPWSYSVDWGDGTIKSGTVSATGSLPEADLTHTYSRRGDFTVTIAVTDANGSSGTASVLVAIVNRPPTAAFGVAPDVADEGATLDYTAAASDPDGDALTYTWSVAKVGSSTVHTSTGSTLSYTYLDDGQYSINLTVSDGALSAAVSKTVNIANVAPTATALAPPEGMVGEPLTLSITNPHDPSPSDLANLAYSFDCGTGYSAPSSSMTHSCVPTSAGSIAMRAKVIDPNGGSTEYSATVNVLPANVAPIAHIAVSGAPVEGSPLTLNGLGSSDPDGHSLSYTWTIANQATPSVATTMSGPTHSVTFPQDGVYVITLTVFDTAPRGSLSTSTTQTVAVANAAPTAFLTGGVGAIAGQAVSVAGGFADVGVNDGPWSWSIDWSHGSPSTGSYTSLSNTTNTSHVYPSAGTYTARITVTDKDGDTGTAELEIVVAPANQAPVASIDVSGPTVEGSPVTLSAAGSSDPDGDPLSYTWTIANENTPSLVTTLTGLTHGVAFPQSGTYLITLTVLDGSPKGPLSTVSTRTLTIDNSAPTAFLTGGVGAIAGQAVSVSAGFADAGVEDGPWSWSIDWGHGLPSTGSYTSLSNTTSTSHVYPSAGAYTARITVTDRDGATGTAELEIVVAPANQPPIASFTTSGSTVEGSTMTLSAASSSDPDGDGLSYVWAIFKNGSSVPFAALTGVSPDVHFDDEGSYEIRLVVTDDNTFGELSATTSHTVVISNAAPVVNLGTVTGVVADQPFNLGGSFADAGEGDAPWAWTINWGSGSPSTGSASTEGAIGATHTYSAAGTYTVQLSVTDSDGATGLATISVVVAPANRAPVAAIGVSGTLVEGSTLTLSGSGSSDPDGDALTYTWTVTNTANSSIVATYTGLNQNVLFEQSGQYAITLTVRDDGPTGALSTAASETIAIGNSNPAAALAPIVSVIAGQPVAISGSFSDAGVHDSPWSWSVDWGTGPASAGSAAVQTAGITASTTYAVAGTYVVKLTVTDKDGGVGTAERTVLVMPANRAPLPEIKVSGTLVEGSTVTLDATDSSDPDGEQTLAYTWTVASAAQPAVVTTLTGAVQTVTLPQNGTYTVTLTVQDNGPNGGLSNAASTSIVVSNAAPVVSSANVTGAVGAPISLPFSFTDAGSLDSPWTVKATWAAGQVTTATANSTGSSALSYTYSAAGTYQVALTVTDKDGAVGSKQVTVTVYAPPVAKITGEDAADVGEALLLSSTGSSPHTSGGALNYLWSISGSSSTYAGPTASFTFPSAGTFTVQLKVTEAQTGLSATASKTITVTAPALAGALILREATFNGGTLIEGSVQIMTAANATFNGGTVTGDLFMAGMPTVVANGKPSYAGTVNGTGSATPTGHRVTLNGNTKLGRVVRRTNPLTMPTVAPPPNPSGSRNVSLNKASDSPGSFSTIRDLTLNGSGMTVAVPGGTYGSFTANSNNVLVLGVAGSSTPTTYNFQNLTLNGSSSIRVVGPVVITLRNKVDFNGSVGATGRPEWLTLRVASGGLTLNSSVAFNGYIVAPNGEVVVNGNSVLTGGVTAQSLTMNGRGRMVLLPR